MQRLELKKQYEVITEKDIEKFEQKYSIKFPDDYKIFLINNRGKIPTKECGYRIQGDDIYIAKDGIIVLMAFMYNIGKDIPKEDTIEWQRECSDAYIPTRFFPIADNSGGDMFCINLQENDDYGSIYFVVHDAYHEDEDVYWVKGDIDKTGCNDMNGVYKLADSFTEFVGKLEPIPEE